MRLTYSNHAYARAEERSLPVLRRLPHGARLLRAESHLTDQGPLLVSEYAVQGRRRIEVTIHRKGWEAQGRAIRRRTEYRLIVREDGVVVTLYWPDETRFHTQATWGRKKTARKAARRREAEAVEEAEDDDMGDECDDLDEWE